MCHCLLIPGTLLFTLKLNLQYFDIEFYDFDVNVIMNINAKKKFILFFTKVHVVNTFAW